MIIPSLRRAAVAAGFVLAVPAAAADPDFALNGETLMWRLDPPGGGAPSYVGGTMHLVDERLDPAVARAIGRLEETGALAVELDIDESTGLRMAERMSLPPGRTLEAIIGEEDFARLAQVAAPYGLTPDALFPGHALWGRCWTAGRTSSPSAPCTCRDARACSS